MLFNTVRAWFDVPSRNPELARSQFKALSTHIPLLCSVLIVSVVALAATHFHMAPLALTVYAPAILCACCAVRLISWWRRRHREIAHREAIWRMRTTVLLAGILGVCFTAWALSLYGYGDAYTQGQVAVFLSITVIGCIFCLLHLRTAALLFAVIVTPPLTIFLASTGNPVFIAISINIAVVVLAMMFILFAQYRDFYNLIEIQKQLVSKNIEMQRLSAENFRLAHFNDLTGLPKRRQFFTELSARLQDARERFAIALIDISGFKVINHVYGHAAGDCVLVEAGHRLRSISNPPCFVARLGADEFGLIVDAPLSNCELRAFGAALCETLRQPFQLPDTTVELAASVGIAAFPEAAESAHRLVERADYALYYAKRTNRGAAVVFSREHESEIYNLSLINQELRLADLERELSLAFHPIVDMDTQTTVSMEALARWNNPRLGEVAPSTFIPAAERLGLIHRLTEVLLSKALAAAQRWPRDVSVAINLSAYDIMSPEAIDRIVETTRGSGVEPARVTFEVTETAAMHDFDQACRSIQALKQLGVRVALDDFGTGYSSLSHVHRLPLDEIKVDRSFIVDIERNATARDVVKSVIDLCRNLNLLCVVEGAETNAQALIVRSLGCRTMQGFLFSKPLDEEKAVDYLVGERDPSLRLEAMPERVQEFLKPIAATG